MSLRLISILIGASTATLFTSLRADAQERRTVAMSCNGTTTKVFLSETVDTHPAFPGGDHKMYGFINENRRYPAKAYEAGIEGRVLCSCIVDSNGDISNIKIVKGVEESLDREAVRIISIMPKWTPGKVDGEPVDTYCLIAVPFRL